MDIFAQAAIGAKFVVLCPANCSRLHQKVYGTEVYTDNSPICLAAIHYGILSDKGGEIEFMIEIGMSDYRGTRGFGITSESKGTHVRSIKFLGTKAVVYYKFREDFSDKITKNWNIYNNKKSDDVTSSFWSVINKSDYVNKEGKKETLKTIMHTGKIRMSGEMNYASTIVLKDAEWANGIIKFNMKLFDDKPVAVLFRYVNQDNYYGVDFSIQSSTGNFKLFSKIEGSVKEIDSKTIKILIDKWYRVQIVLEFDEIKVLIQNDKIREKKLIFNKKVEGISRGSLAFATNGNTKFFINGVIVDDYNKYKKELFPDNKRSWNNLMKHLSSKDRKIYCRDIFDNEKEEIQRCIDPHFYCSIRCDELISTVENLLNLSCFNDCVRTSNTELAKKQGQSLKTVMGNHTWIPKQNDKCDYKPNDEEQYRMATIKSVKRKGDDFIVTVSYNNAMYVNQSLCCLCFFAT